MKIFTLIYTLYLLLILTSCDFADDKLVVANQIKDSIAFIIPTEPNYFPTFDDSKRPEINEHLNDSLLNTFAKYDPAEESFGGVHFLAGNSSKHLRTFNIRWEQIIEETPDKKLRVFFVPTQIMTSGKYKWKEIYEQKMFKETEFTIEELDNLNWTINYKN